MDETKNLSGKQRRVKFNLQFSFVFALTLAFSSSGLLSGLELPVWIVFGFAVIPWVAFLPEMFANNSTVEKNYKRDNSIVILLVALLAFQYITAILRSSYSDISTIPPAVNSVVSISILNLSLVFCALLALKLAPLEMRAQLLMGGLTKSMFLICIAELLLISIGVQHSKIASFPQTQAPTFFGSLISTTIYRQLLPISSGMHNALVIPLILVCCSIANYSKIWSLKNILALGIAVYILIIVDSRSFLTAAPMAAVVLWAFNRSKKMLPFICGLLPFSTIAALGLSAWFPFIASIASARYDSAGMFSGRERIWGSFVEPFFGKGLLQTFLGFGLFGQVVSRMNEGYSILFSSFSEGAKDIASLHNSYLQILADSGIVGFIASFLIVWISIYRLHNAMKGSVQEPIWRCMLLSYISILLVATSEVSLTPYSRETFVAVFFITAISLFFTPILDSERINIKSIAVKNEKSDRRV